MWAVGWEWQHDYSIFFGIIESINGQMRLSKRSKQGFSFEHFVCSLKCFRKSKSACVFHPFRRIWKWFRKWSRKLTRGKIKYGGVLFPVAETAQANVTRVTLSADVSDPTCLNLHLANTLYGLCTVVTPVSSTFQMSLRCPTVLLITCTLTQFYRTTPTHCTNTTYLLSLDTIQCKSTTLHMYNLLHLCTTICCTTNLLYNA